MRGLYRWKNENDGQEWVQIDYGNGAGPVRREAYEAGHAKPDFSALPTKHEFDHNA